MRPRSSWSIHVALGYVVMAISCTLSRAQFFRIEPLEPRRYAPAVAVSEDGRTVVGYSEAGARPVSYTWTSESGRIDWLAPEHRSSNAFGISANARFYVGNFGMVGSDNAFRREISTGQLLVLNWLPTFPGNRALGVADDGSVMVGRQFRGDGNGDGSANASMAVRWDASGAVTPMGYLRAGDNVSEATAVTPDGNTIVGSSRSGFDVAYPYRWTVATGMVGLQIPNAGFPSGWAHAVSRDGQYVAGRANGAIPGSTTGQAVRWNSSGQWEYLGAPAGHDGGTAYGISADGKFVVGQLFFPGGGLNALTAFVWHEGEGTMSLAAYLRDRGLDIPATTYLSECRGVSADGRVFVGRCFDTGNSTINQGFVAVLPAACSADFNQDGGVDGGDVEAFFNAWENAEPSADVNNDGGIDGMDVERFFGEWEAGGC